LNIDYLGNAFIKFSIFNFEGFVKSQKISLLSFRRKPESSHFNSFWTPAFAGETEEGRFTRPSIFNSQFRLGRVREGAIDDR